MVILSIILAALFAQASAAISFDSISYDFGIQPSSVESLTHEFVFTNNSGKAVSISYAVSTCSCTKLKWTTGPVRPGESGVVRAVYVRERNVDSFEKFISVFLEGQSKPYVLRIAGSFTEAPESLLADFPARSGSLGFYSLPVVVGEVYSGTLTEDSFWVANFSNKAAAVSFKDTPSGMKITPEVQTIRPMERARFNYAIEVDKKCWGRKLYKAVPVVNGAKSAPVYFSLTATEDFTSLSREERESGPLPRVLDRTCTFGTVHAGQSAEATFRVENVASKVLKIRAAFSDEEGISIKAPSSIKAHEVATFKVSIPSSVLSAGENSFKLYVQSDSPLMQIVEVYVKGTVE